jgi:hypothetical protein
MSTTEFLPKRALTKPRRVDHARREVEVHVRLGRALRVEEALEQRAVLERVDVGDAERPADDRDPPALPRPGPTMIGRFGGPS